MEQKIDEKDINKKQQKLFCTEDWKKRTTYNWVGNFGDSNFFNI